VLAIFNSLSLRRSLATIHKRAQAEFSDGNKGAPNLRRKQLRELQFWCQMCHHLCLRCYSFPRIRTFAATSTPPMPFSTCQLVTPGSILRPNRSVLQQRALVVSDTHVQLSRAYEAHERAVSWKTSSCAWLANVCSIEMYHSLRPLPESFS